jgi:uncharacterized phage protein (TIGR02216 family)
MAFGLGALRLSSADFWALTPLELAAAATGIHGRRAQEPIGRAALAELLQSFPDIPNAQAGA